MAEQYSLSRLLAAAVNHNPDAAAYELSVSEALSDRLTTENGRQVADRAGYFVPLAALETGTSAAGGSLVIERDGGFKGALRPRTVLERLGASITFGATPPLRVTTQTAASEFTWIDENPVADVGDSAPAFGEAVLTLRTGVATVPISRQLLRQATPNTEHVVRRDLGAVAGAGIEQTALNGSGVAPEPAGLLVHDDLPVIAIGANGGAPTYSHICQLEEAVGNADGDTEPGAVGFLTTPTMRRVLRETERATGSGVIWGDSGLLGYRSEVSTLMPSDLTKGTASGICHAIVFGDWSRLHVSVYALEILVDPITRVREGLVEVTLFAHAGIAVSHPGAFAAILDATAA